MVRVREVYQSSHFGADPGRSAAPFTRLSGQFGEWPLISA